MTVDGHLRTRVLSDLAYAPIGGGSREATNATGGGRLPPQRGVSFERSVRDQLRRWEWFVLRSPGSKGPIDLISIRKGFPTLWIQAKVGGVISSTEWNAVMDVAEQYGGWPVLAMRTSPRKTGFFRLDGRREFAEKTRLWAPFDPGTLAGI